MAEAWAEVRGPSGEWARDPAHVHAVFVHDPPTEHHISATPRVSDPYESSTVEVRASRIAHECANEGLFARRVVRRGQLLCYYSGLKLPFAAAEARPDDWSQSANVINLDPETAIDVPPPWDNPQRYRATLGHKANHASPPANNAEYCAVFHPRFGECKAIRAVLDIPQGEEILVDYGYTDESPHWWNESAGRSDGSRA
jgi:hypothetical protein